MATTVSTVVIAAITVSGRPKRMVWLIVLTSRVTRVTRSPELALSTRPSGRPSTVRTMCSRASASTSWPKHRRHPQGQEGHHRLDHHDTGHGQGQPVQRRGQGARRRGPVDQLAEDPRHDQTGDRGQGVQDQQRGHRASAPAAVARRRRPTARRSATGSPARVAGTRSKLSSARCSRSRCRPRQARSRSPTEPVVGGRQLRRHPRGRPEPSARSRRTLHRVPSRSSARPRRIWVMSRARLSGLGVQRPGHHASGSRGRCAAAPRGVPYAIDHAAGQERHPVRVVQQQR